MKKEKFLSWIAAGLLLWGCATSEQNRQRAKILSNMGFSHLQQGDSTSALRELLEAANLTPKDPTVHYGLGLAYNAKSRHALALEHFDLALKLDPKYTEVRNALGATYLELGQWDLAIREFETALQDLLYPTPFYLWNNLGWAHFKKGNPRQAVDCYRKALALKPDFGLAYYNLGLAYKEARQTEEAIKALRSATVQVPDFPAAQFHLGVLCFDTGRKREARKAFEEVVRLAPESENARLARQYLDLLNR